MLPWQRACRAWGKGRWKVLNHCVLKKKSKNTVQQTILPLWLNSHCSDAEHWCREETSWASLQSVVVQRHTCNVLCLRRWGRAGFRYLGYHSTNVWLIPQNHGHIYLLVFLYIIFIYLYIYILLYKNIYEYFSMEKTVVKYLRLTVYAYLDIRIAGWLWTLCGMIKKGFVHCGA